MGTCCREVDVGRTLSETEYIGMCRREVLDNYLRQRAEKNGATVINGLLMRMQQPEVSTPAVWVWTETVPP